MSGDVHTQIDSSLASLPSRDEVRQLIAENLQQRQMLRRLLRLAGFREAVAARNKPTANRADESPRA